MGKLTIELVLRNTDLEILANDIWGSSRTDDMSIDYSSLIDAVNNLTNENKMYPISERNMIIFLYYRSGKTTFRELGEIFNISGNRARQISNYVLKAFKHPRIGRKLYEITN